MSTPPVIDRAYSLLEVKAVDQDRRVITGIATSPEPDRMGDIIVAEGCQFANPVPLLLFHDKTNPVGTVTFSKPTKQGVAFEARIPEIDTPGPLKDQIDRAWQLVKLKLVKGVSIGFRPLNDAIELLKTGGLRFLETEILELSLVTVPANASATIHTIKTFDHNTPAVVGTRTLTTPAVVGAPVVRVRPETRMARTITEQMKDFEGTRETKRARMTELMSKDEGVTLDQAESEEYDTLKSEIDSINKHLTRLADLEEVNKTTAKPVNGDNPEKASASRGGYTPVTTTRDNLPPGISFARSVMCQVQARLDGFHALEVAKARYPHDQRLHQFMQLKAAVPAGTTTNDPWASPLVDPTNLASEFIEYLRPRTILGQFGTNGVPSLDRVPFNIRVTGQTTGGSAQWVGQGRAKPVTSFGFEAITLLYTKIAAIAVITEELARFSSPSAETRVRDSLAKAVIERMDIDFIDPAQAAVSGVNPASITNGLTPLSSAGPTADNVRTDLVNLLSSFIENNQDPSGLVLIMPSTLGLALSIMTNSLGQAEFPAVGMTGGKLNGIPVITSQYAANASGSGNLVIAVNANEILLADDGQVRVDASNQASIEMSDAPLGRSDVPTASSVSVVSMYQTNSIALKAERFINWAKRRDEAVVFMDDVNWSSVGSPP